MYKTTKIDNQLKIEQEKTITTQALETCAPVIEQLRGDPLSDGIAFVKSLNTDLAFIDIMQEQLGIAIPETPISIETAFANAVTSPESLDSAIMFLLQPNIARLQEAKTNIRKLIAQNPFYKLLDRLFIPERTQDTRNLLIIRTQQYRQRKAILEKIISEREPKAKIYYLMAILLLRQKSIFMPCGNDWYLKNYDSDPSPIYAMCITITKMALNLIHENRGNQLLQDMPIERYDVVEMITAPILYTTVSSEIRKRHPQLSLEMIKRCDGWNSLPEEYFL